MKISKMVTLVKESINPNLESDKVWNLYSLPSFDAGKQCEIVLGSVIQSNKFIVPNRCILFNKLNVRFKRIWQIDNELPSKICSTEFLPLVVNEDKVDFNFIYYLLQSNFITNYLCGQNQSTSNSHKRIDVDNFFEIDVPVPDLPTQRKIAAVLSSLDNKIEVNRRINAKLEQMAKRIFDYWYVQFDFPNTEGKPYKSSGGKMVYNATLKRKIPEGWELKKFSDVCDVFNGATPSTSDVNNYGGDIVWITPKDLSDQKCKFIYEGERSITQKGYDSCSTVLLPKGTVVMSSRAPIGLVSVAATELCTNQGFKNLVPKDVHYTNLLFYTLLLNMPQIKRFGSGTTFNEVSKDEISQIKIIYPSGGFIKSFDEKTHAIFEQQLLLQKENQRLTALRDKLLTLLLNGQVAVK